jgi:radical SAM protein with 4Fe4S-binding SPASM domain
MILDKFLIDGHKLKYHPVEVAKFYQGEIFYPIYVEISPTALCNHRCIFCNYNYLGHSGKFPRHRMITLVDELAKLGVKSLVFAGTGEPFLHEDTINAIIQARQQGIDSAVSTNGVLLKEDMIKIIAEKLTWIRFSFNGGNDENYSKIHRTSQNDYYKALENIKKLLKIKNKLKSKITVGIQFILLPENKDFVIETGKMFKEVGVDYFVVKHFYHHPKNNYRIDESFRRKEFVSELQEIAQTLSTNEFNFIVRDYKRVEEVRKYKKCYGLEFIVYIREDGEVYTCFSYQEDKNTSIGNILNKTFEEVWLSPQKKKAIEYINNIIDKTKCQQNCRHHQINNYLWDLKHPEIRHLNFI